MIAAPITTTAICKPTISPSRSIGASDQPRATSAAIGDRSIGADARSDVGAKAAGDGARLVSSGLEPVGAGVEPGVVVVSTIETLVAVGKGVDVNVDIGLGVKVVEGGGVAEGDGVLVGIAVGRSAGESVAVGGRAVAEGPALSVAEGVGVT